MSYPGFGAGVGFEVGFGVGNGFFLMKILAARSVGSSDTFGAWTSGLSLSSTRTEIAVFP